MGRLTKEMAITRARKLRGGTLRFRPSVVVVVVDATNDHIHRIGDQLPVFGSFFFGVTGADCSGWDGGVVPGSQVA